MKLMTSNNSSQQVLKAKVQSVERVIQVGARYRHYKNREAVYTVLYIGVSTVSEDLEVVYRAEYGPKLIFVRPVSEWNEYVEWQGKQVPRFEHLLK